MERAELIELVRATGCAEESGGFVFLCDPKWSAMGVIGQHAVLDINFEMLINK